MTQSATGPVQPAARSVADVIARFGDTTQAVTRVCEAPPPAPEVSGVEMAFYTVLLIIGAVKVGTWIGAAIVWTLTKLTTTTRAAWRGRSQG